MPSKILNPLNALFFITVLLVIQSAVLGYNDKIISDQTSFIWGISYILLIGWWIDNDRKINRHDYPFEFGYFIFVLWPIILPHYLTRTRGIKGVFQTLGFYVLPFLPLFSYVISRVIAS